MEENTRQTANPADNFVHIREFLGKGKGSLEISHHKPTSEETNANKTHWAYGLMAVSADNTGPAGTLRSQNSVEKKGGCRQTK